MFNDVAEMKSVIIKCLGLCVIPEPNEKNVFF